MRKILTYVSSQGLNPFTGETYPDATPKERTIAEIYSLLQSGHTVQDRSFGGCDDIIPNIFFDRFKDVLEPKKEIIKPKLNKEEVKGGKQ